jgi:single-strand DNA-binding protein
VYETNVTIVGRMISEPEYKQTRNDVEVTTFRMASNERRYDKETREWVDGDSLFVHVTCWRRLAFTVQACLHKGEPVMVTGRLYSRSFEVDGSRRMVTEMEAWAVGPDLNRCTLTIHRKQGDRKTETASPEQPGQAEQAGHAEHADRSVEVGLPEGEVPSVDATELVASAA